MKLVSTAFMNCPRYLLFVFLFLSGPLVLAQNNLVPNGGFEEVKPGKPSRTFKHFTVPFTTIIAPWYIPNAGTSDFYNSDQSAIYLNVPVKNARNGNGRVGLALGSADPKKNSYCEYLQVKLVEPLVKDSLYCVSFHYSLDKRCRYYAPVFGLAFTHDPISRNDPNVLDVKAQVLSTDTVKHQETKGWQSYQTVYRATGTEQYLTLGRFETILARPHASTEPISQTMNDFAHYAYYYFDDVAVVPLGPNKDCTTETTDAVVSTNNHFLFLVDVSASMIKASYLDSVKTTLRKFLKTCNKNDKVSIVSFDSRPRVLLKSHAAGDVEKINTVLGNLGTGPTTNIEKAIEVTYKVMDTIMVPGANNRVVLLSDAVFKFSDKGRKNIMDHYHNSSIYFSMVQYGKAENKTMRKVCDAAGGKYTMANEGRTTDILNVQLTRPQRRPDYTAINYKMGWDNNK